MCKRKNAIGIEKIDEQSAIVGVKFIKPRNGSILPSPVKKLQPPVKVVKSIEQKKQITELMNKLNL